jgi:hypothetical protein
MTSLFFAPVPQTAPPSNDPWTYDELRVADAELGIEDEAESAAALNLQEVPVTHSIISVQTVTLTLRSLPRDNGGSAWIAVRDAAENADAKNPASRQLTDFNDDMRNNQIDMASEPVTGMFAELVDDGVLTQEEMDAVYAQVPTTMLRWQPVVKVSDIQTVRNQ